MGGGAMSTDQELLAEQGRLQEEAAAVRTDLALDQRFSDIGTVTLVGSVSHTYEHFRSGSQRMPDGPSSASRTCGQATRTTAVPSRATMSTPPFSTATFARTSSSQLGSSSVTTGPLSTVPADSGPRPPVVPGRAASRVVAALSASHRRRPASCLSRPYSCSSTTGSTAERRPQLGPHHRPATRPVPRRCR